MKFSVVPMFNRAAMFHPMLTALIAQDYPDDEIIVVEGLFWGQEAEQAS